MSCLDDSVAVEHPTSKESAAPTVHAVEQVEEEIEPPPYDPPTEVGRFKLLQMLTHSLNLAQ